MNENTIKHLEFLQENISRMNSCSFQMKGWAIAIVSALLAIYASTINELSSGNVHFIFVAIVPTLLFWYLDSFYLCQERKMRGIYEDILDDPDSISLFSFPMANYKKDKYSMLSAMFSKTEATLYLTLSLCLLIGGLLLK